MAFLSKKLATIKKDIELDNFYLEKYLFNKDTILNDNVKKLFQRYEFHSLYKEDKELKTWKDLNLKVQIITKDEDLEKLLKTISQYEKVFFDTETTSLEIMKAQLVGISIYLDNENIFYINHMHD